MELIGAVSVILLYICFITFVTSGRWAFVALGGWLIPCIGSAYFAPADSEVNGLVILICLVSAVIGYWSMVGFKMWNVKARTEKAYVKGIFFAVSLIFVYYCAYESQRLGYIPNFQGIGTDAFFRKWFIIAVIFIINIVYTKLLLFVTDSFFSQKKDFVLIKCETFISGSFGRFSEKLLKNRYLCGINNGKEYYFGINRKAYIVLKDMRICKIKLKKGVLGGIYVPRYPEGIDIRLSEAADKWLRKKAVLATVLYVLAVICVFKLS